MTAIVLIVSMSRAFGSGLIALAYSELPTVFGSNNSLRDLNAIDGNGLILGGEPIPSRREREDTASKPDVVGGKITADGDLTPFGSIQFLGIGANTTHSAEAASGPCFDSATGSLDPTFGTGGKQTTDMGGNSFEQANSVAIQPDGKIVTAGYTSGATTDFALARYNTDGSLDTTFDGDGKVTTAIGIGGIATSVAIQPDGKIVAAGNSLFGSSYDFALVRYNPDGSLDATFDGDGKVTTDFGGIIDQANSVAIQQDGKIIAAGYSRIGSNTDFALARYNADGSLDTTFNTDGKLTTAIGSGTDQANSVAIQQDGKIVAAGYSRIGLTDDIALVRYNADGSLDTTFDGDGKVTTSIGSSTDRANAAAIQPDGKIVAAGYSRIGSTDDFALARYNTDGSLDTTFDGDGKVTTDIGTSTDWAFSVAIQPDGKIAAAGNSFNGSIDDFALVRYNADGSLDTTFGGDGKVTTTIGSSTDRAYAVAIQPDGRIVAAGYDLEDFAIARYNPDGSLDATFDGDGKLTTNFGSGNNFGTSTAVQPDGKIVVAGYSNGATIDFVLARYNADGSLDTTFDGDGKVTTAIGISTDQAYSVAIQPDGKIVAAGYSQIGSNNDFALARYNPDGSLVATFDGDGKLTTNVGGNDYVRSVAIQADGKIVAAGYSQIGSNNDFALASYNADGSLDTTFDGDGKVTTAIGTSTDQAFSVAIQPDGKIVVAGYSSNDSGDDFALARYNTDGSLDTTFDGDGKVTTDIGTSTDWAFSVAIQPDGKIVTAGYSIGTTIDVPIVFALARYNADGSLDTTFDGDGKVTTAIGTSTDQANSVAIQQDGKIVAAGRSFTAVYSDIALVRYNVDGSLDMSFDGDGKLTTSIGNGSDSAGSVAIQPDGRIVAAGSSSNGFDYDFAVVRYGGTCGPGKAARAIGDFDGDGRTDVSVFRPAEGNWYVNGSNGGLSVVKWGAAGDRLIPGDYDGDGKADYAVWRPSDTPGTADFYILNSNGFTYSGYAWGSVGDVPVPGDYDGDGQADIAVYRPTTGDWWIYKSQTLTGVSFQFGSPGDVPLAMDIDGDSKADLAVYRPSDHAWYMAQASGTPAQNFTAVTFGLPADVLVPADYDGDGRTDAAVFRPDEGNWYILRSADGGVTAEHFGLNGDIPVAGDYDGDGKADIAVFRPTESMWYLMRTTSGFSAQAFGTAGDVPIPAAYHP